MLDAIGGRSSGVESKTLVQQAAQLAPAFRTRAWETERLRQVPKQSIADLTGLNLFGMLRPKCFGGYECDFGTFIDVVVGISAACASTGWVLSLSSICQWVLALFPQQAQEEVWAENPVANLQAGLAPSAVALEIPQAFRISGTWNFVSGCDHADWIFLGALLPSAAGQPVPGFLLLPREELRIDDNWHTVGLCGTGSKNVVVENAIVPKHRAVSFPALSSGAAPGTAINRNPIYKIPLMAIIPLAIATPALGIAIDALQDFVGTARERTTKGAVAGAGSKMAEFPAIQTRVAEASGLIDAAQLLLKRDVDDVMTVLAAGSPIDVSHRIRNRRDHALAVKFCVQAVNELYSSTGANGLFLDGRLQRAWRDVNSIAKHIGVNWDALSTMYGQHALGLEPKGQY